MCQFKFVNFIPSRDLEVQAQLVLDRLTEVAPYDSSQNAELYQVGDHYRAEFEILSIGCHCEAVVDSFDATEAVERAGAQILGQLAAWKKQRFIPQPEETPYPSTYTPRRDWLKRVV